MIPRKKRRLIIISVIALTVVIIIAILLALYIGTDMFKSNKTLFAKYIAQGIQNLETIYSAKQQSDYTKMLESGKYNTTTQIKVNFTENIGTSRRK